MAKEMMIVFVYDTLRCLAESDDPADAVLYFHPGWVSDSQRMSLCGQLMGVTHCLKAIFSAPQVLALHSGKFVIHEYGRYILAVGSDRNIPDWMLKNRAEILTSLIKVYHCDLQTVAAHFPGENNPRFSQKLYQMFETYLPVLQYGGYMFQTVPLLNLPKSATNIFLESMQVLDYCQKIKGVLGGTILYNNKIVATQLNSKLTSRLSMVDPYRIKSPAESVSTEFELPHGSQLLIVYIRKKYYDILKKDAERVRLWQQNGFDKIKTNNNKNSMKQNKEPVLGPMKRDKSLLFTAVPEEDIHTSSPSPTSPKSNEDMKSKEASSNTTTMPDVVPFCSKPRVRPNKLALSFKNSVSRDSINEDCVPSVPTGPVFTGQTSVCSTPMLEFKRLHGNVMSICRNVDDQLLTDALNGSENIPMDNPTEIQVDKPPMQDIEPVIRPEDNVRKMSKDLKATCENMVNKPLVNMRKIKSLSDINSSFKRISHLAAMRFGKSGITNKNLSLNCDQSPDEMESLDKISVTITDPYYPVFSSEGIPISKSLFDEYILQHYAEMDKASKEFDLKCDFDLNKINASFKDFDANKKSSPVRRKSLNEVKMTNLKDNEVVTKADPLRRKSLCLPLKSLGNEKSIESNSSLFDSQNRKKMSGVQLTPLMEKLSHLAFSEKSSGYSSRGVTPMEFKDFQLSTPCVEKKVIFPESTKEKNRKSESGDSDSESDEDSQMSSFSIDCVKSVLFVFGLQNMSMVLLLEEGAASDLSIVNNLCEASVSSLGAIEQLCMEPLPGCEESSEAYSFLSLDPQWGAVKKGGPWASGDVAIMGYIHKDFKEDPSLTEIIIRNEESLVFGTSCGGAEVYYQESGCKQPGLPTPADLMGTAPLKAKRRLQRDHSITIF